MEILKKCRLIAGFTGIFCTVLLVVRLRTMYETLLIGLEENQQYLTVPSESRFVNRLLQEDNKVRDCISGSVVRYHANMQTQPFKFILDNAGNVNRETTENRQKAFESIYKAHKWGSRLDPDIDEKLQSVAGSGRGSTLTYAIEIMSVLHIVINELKFMTGKDKIRLLDVPCGDFQWMYRFLQQRTDVLYTGADIVPNLIEHHTKTFQDNHDWRFVNIDIAVTPLAEEYDLVLTRCMLQHLTTSDAMKVLKNVGDSGSKYLLATTHSFQQQNVDLRTLGGGRHRPVNLEIPPFSLEPPICISRDGPIKSFLGIPVYVALWKLPLRQVSSCKVSLSQEKTGKGNATWICV